MKKRNILYPVIALGVLAWILFATRKKPEVSESLPPETHESAQDLPAPAETPAPSQPAPAPVTSATPAPAEEAATETTEPVQDESATVPSDEVAAKIKKNLAGARKLLQQKAAIEKAKSEEVHETPKVTVDAARRLGEIAELEAAHPEQAETFREFYLECARDESTMTVTRAQCLDKYIKAAKLDAAAQKQFLAEFPEEIVRLVEALQ
jgi:cytoskeletal protein RodZ